MKWQARWLEQQWWKILDEPIQTQAIAHFRTYSVLVTAAIASVEQIAQQHYSVLYKAYSACPPNRLVGESQDGVALDLDMEDPGSLSHETSGWPWASRYVSAQ